MTDVEPIIMTFEVPLGPAEAFELFTTELDTWWPLKGHSCTDDEHSHVRFDRRTGGNITEVSADGSRQFVWGTLSAWNPPDGFTMTWHPGQQVERATRLTLSFTAADGGCVVTLLHDGWDARGEDGAKVRGMYSNGWVGVSRAYVLRASSNS